MSRGAESVGARSPACYDRRVRALDETRAAPRRAALALVCALTAAASLRAGDGPPSFVVILADDQGWSQVSRPVDPDVPASGSAYLETPHLDRLAASGLTFTDAYAPAPLCTPTRRSLLCGTSAVTSGTEFKSSWVPAGHATIPRALARLDAGYRSAHFGKWGAAMGSTPEECGYDESDGPTSSRVGGAGSAEDKHLSHVVDDPKRTASITARAVEFLRARADDDGPFYLQVSYYAPHLRVELTQATLDAFEAKGPPDRRYTPGWAGMLAELDAGVGELLGALDALGLARDTFVIYTSDNGGWAEIRGSDATRPPANLPLRGGKHGLFEGGLRVPLFVRGPGVEADGTCRVPVALQDLLPTVYELAGGTDALPDSVDGGSLRGLLAAGGTGSVERAFDGLAFHRPARRVSALRRGDHKLIVTLDGRGRVQERRLFDVVRDRGEEHDLAADRVELAQSLERALLEHLVAAEAEQPADFATPR